MAKIIEEAILVKFSRIVKDSTADTLNIATPDILSALEQVAQELVGESAVVETVHVAE